MTALDQRSRLPEPIDVEPKGCPDCEVRLERRYDLLPAQIVSILLGNGALSCMETGLGFDGVQDPDVGRQTMIRAVDESRRRPSTLDLEMDHLTSSMHSRVSPSGTEDTNYLAEQIFEGFLKHLLYGSGIGLALPARIGLTAIRES